MDTTIGHILEERGAAYRSIPFWSWNNFLDEAELCRQIDDMHRAGIGGFIMHARTGLKEEYLGEKWFSCIDACLKKARELGMEAWIYDENGWPSGFVGGKLLENEAFRARFLEYAVGAFDPAAFAVFVRRGGGFVRVGQPQAGEETYHNVYLRVSPANTDILNPAVTEAFLAETHEKYYARFRESFGRELAGFFTDEPQYYRWGTPYTPVAAAEFSKGGADIRDGLIWLFVQGEDGYAFREKYFSTLNRLYVENFYKKVYDWCHAHGCRLTGHSVEESCLYTQMWGGAAVMPSYEFEDIPGIDWLGRDCGTELAPRQVGSAAAQLGKKFVLTETFGCSGYDVTPKELKSLAEYQYFNGVNKMCQHLYPYSMAGQGKTDHPPVFSSQANWFEGFRAFNTYFTRLGCLVGETQDVYEVGILHPMRDIWLEYVRSEDYASVRETEDAFRELLLRLRKRGVTFHLLDERLLERHGSVEGGKLRCGNCVYDTVIVPKMRTLAPATLALLQAFTGKLCMLGEPCFVGGVRQAVPLRPNTTFEAILAAARFGFSCEDGNSVLTARRGEPGEFLFVKNLSRTEESRVRIAGAAGRYAVLDLEKMEEQPLSEEEFLLGASESRILVRREGVASVAQKETVQDVTAAFRVTGMTENYLVLDHVQIARGDAPFGEKMPVSAAFESLLRENYKGVIRVRQTFTLQEAMPLTLVMERAKLLAASVNGRPLQFTDSRFDVNFAEADVSAAVRAGENEFVYSLQFWQHEGVRFALFDPLATESLRNCLYYDTSIEPVYLKGCFVVGEGHVLAPRRTLPPITDRLFEKGYPFFKGALTLEGELWYGGGRAELALFGRFMEAEISANGQRCVIALDTKGDISSLLREGKNTVRIVLHASLRNLFGPHHYCTPEPVGVSPYNFVFRGQWGGGTPDDYTEEYHSVPFGVHAIVLKSAQKQDPQKEF